MWYPVKDYPVWLFVFSVPWIIGRTVGVVFYYLVKGKFDVIFKSKMDGVYGLKKMLYKRIYIYPKSGNNQITKFIKIWAFS